MTERRDKRRTISVKLILKASSLRNTSIFSLKKSSPFAVVTKLPYIGSKEEPCVIGQTEPIQNTLDPHWMQHFILDYEFGKEMNLDITIYDNVKKGDTREPKVIASGKIEVGRILGKRHNCTAARLKPSGTLYAAVVPFEVPGVRKNVHFTLVGTVKSKVRVYYEVQRRDFYDSAVLWTPIYRSESIAAMETVEWEENTINLLDVGNKELRASGVTDGSTDCPIRIVFWEHRKFKRHRVLSSFETTIASLVRVCKNERILELTDGIVENAKVASLHFSGENEDDSDLEDLGTNIPRTLTKPEPQDPAPRPKPTFLDYQRNDGLDLDLSVAIDFTSSNGNPMVPGTPHYIDDRSLNQYQKAIIAIGSIVANFDSDQRSQVWGFGAKYEGVVRHAFQVGDHSHVSGVRGILEAYRQTFLRGIRMSGPVVLTEVIKIAARKAKVTYEKALGKGKLSYSILLILTHGCVTDIEATKNMLKEVEDSPISIIIIGIGDNDFSAMKFLDDFQDKEGGRDICNFVKFDADKDRTALTEEALNEIPDQLTSYFFSRGILPLKSESEEEEEIELEEFNEYPECNVAHSFEDGGLSVRVRQSAFISQQYQDL